MDTHQHSLHALQDIRRMMDRSSRFVSLSGWSGIAAGICALVGAHYANGLIEEAKTSGNTEPVTPPAAYQTIGGVELPSALAQQLMGIAFVTLAAAFILAVLFTWLRSRKTGVPLWGSIARRLAIATLIPMAVGGIFLLQLYKSGAVGLVAPGCLLFYGLALLNASKFTMVEIRYLGYAMLATGLVSLLFPGYGLYFWAFGFGILHIAYGIVMWWRHEKNTAHPQS